MIGRAAGLYVSRQIWLLRQDHTSQDNFLSVIDKLPRNLIKPWWWVGQLLITCLVGKWADPGGTVMPGQLLLVTELFTFRIQKSRLISDHLAIDIATMHWLGFGCRRRKFPIGTWLSSTLYRPSWSDMQPPWLGAALDTAYRRNMTQAGETCRREGMFFVQMPSETHGLALGDCCTGKEAGLCQGKADLGG